MVPEHRSIDPGRSTIVRLTSLKVHGVLTTRLVVEFGGFPSQWASNAENVFMSWPLHISGSSLKRVRRLQL